MGAINGVKDWYKDDPLKRHFYLGGFAGTGKSTLLPVLIDALDIDPSDIAFMAPTGKAARVMRTKLKEADVSADCKTIHSSIYLPSSQKADVLEKQKLALEMQIDSYGLTQGTQAPDDLLYKLQVLNAELDEAYIENEGPRFFLNIESPVFNRKLIICDEASMVGARIADDLYKMGVPLVAIGDPGQLPPVKDDAGLTDRDPDYFLTEIHRQAADNPIIWLSKLARDGKDIPVGNYGDAVRVVRRRDDDLTFNPEVNVQIIVGTHKKRWRVNEGVRNMMGYKSSGPCAGEPLLVCKNSRNTPSLINGLPVLCVEDVGDLTPGIATFPLRIQEEEGGTIRWVQACQGIFEETFLKQKDGFSCDIQAAYKAKKFAEHIDWGWCLTCHKAQGSQWDAVVLHDESSCFREDARKWLYTGITRAAEKLMIVYP
jgi:exodeoxyribonuclease-5